MEIRELLGRKKGEPSGLVGGAYVKVLFASGVLPLILYIVALEPFNGIIALYVSPPPRFLYGIVTFQVSFVSISVNTNDELWKYPPD